MMRKFTKLAALVVGLLMIGSGVTFGQNVCATALPMEACTVYTGSTVGVPNDGTVGAGACANVGTGGQQWYTFTAADNNTYTLSMCGGGTNYDSRIHVFSGDCNTLTCVGNNDDFCGLQSQFTWAATAGTTYLIRIGGFGGATGNYAVTLSAAGQVCGCTDDTACNYDPAATTDNGTCCFGDCIGLVVGGGAFAGEVGWSLQDNQGNTLASGGAPFDGVVCIPGPACDYQFVMTDSFGDGWNGNTFTLTNGDGSVAATGTLTAGAGPEVVTVGLGFPSGCTDMLATNYDPDAVCDNNSCVYCGPGEQLLIFNMDDTFGDGWNGGSYFITDENGGIVATGSLDNGAFGDGQSAGFDIFCLAPGCYYVTIAGSTFPEEIGWSVEDANGNIVLSASAPNGSTTNAGFAWGGQTGCEILGCTDPGCNNYNPNATTDDGSCICPPANDLCADAIDIACGLSANGTTINSNFDDDAAALGACQGIAVTSPGVWYRIIGTGEQISVTTCGSSPNGTVTDTKLHVFAGTCNNLTCVAANDDDANCTFFKSTVVFTSLAGVNYYVLVSEFGAGQGIDFILDVTCTDCGSPILNDDCATALPQPDNIPTPGNLCCANPDDVSDCAAFVSGYGVWYTMNSGSFDTFDFTLVNGDVPGVDANDGTNVGMVVFSSAGDCNSLTAIACCPTVADVCAGSLYEAGIPVTQNTQYYFLVYTTDPGNCGNFTLNTNLSNVGCTDETADNYDPTADIDDGSCTYTTAPENDLCADAIVLNCGDVINGTTGASTNTGAPNVCPISLNDNGVWYTFVGDGSYHTISTCGSAIDTRIEVVSSANGCGGPFTCVVSEDDDGSNEGCGFFDADDASVEFISTAGVTYYVYITAGAVDTNNDFVDDLFDGPFTLSFECDPVVNGCTDGCACNYNPDANVEDDSCEYFSCVECTEGSGYMMFMQDDFGDGWNGGTYTIEDLDGNVIASGDLDGAQCVEFIDNFAGADQGFDIVCLADGCYNITVGGGTFPGELIWELQDQNGDVIVGGGATTESFTIGAGLCGCTDPGACNYLPNATDDDGSCEYDSCAGCTDNTACNYDPDATIPANNLCCYDNCVTLIMNDSFGDGWNGNTAVIIDADNGAIVGTATLPAGSTGTASFCLPTGCYTMTVGGGAFPGEVSWVLTGTNNGILNGGVNTTGILFSVGDGGNCTPGCTEPMACNYDPEAGLSDCTLCEYTSCLGCTYEQAENYNPDALIDDGSCVIVGNNPCPADLNEDGVVGVGDLILFIVEFGTVCE